MKKHLWKELFLIAVVCLVLTGVLFRQYFFDHKVPFPSNLLVSFYQPWASYPNEGYPMGPPAKPIGFDALRSFYPTRTLVTEALKSGRLPLWNPYSFSGNTLLGVYQSAVFHPLSFLFLLVPQIDAWSIIIFLTPVFTGVFTYLFLRELELSWPASLFGAVTFAFCGMMIAWWEEMFMATYSFLILPIILYAIKKIFTSPTRWPFALLVLSLSWSIFSGWFQATLYVLVISAIWAIFVASQSRGSMRRLLLTFAGFAVAFLVSGIQLAPGLEAYQHSARGNIDTKQMFADFFVPVGDVVTLIAPDYYGNPAAYNYRGGSFYHERVVWFGVAGLLFAVYELLLWRRLSANEKFFTTAGLISLSLGFALPTSWFLLYTLHLPFFREITPSRIFFLSSFCLTISASFGLQRFITNPDKKRIFLAAAVLVCLTLAAWAPVLMTFHPKFQKLLAFPHPEVTLRNLIIPTIFIVLLCLSAVIRFVPGLGKKIFYLLIIGVSLGGIWYFGNKYLYFSERSFVFPLSPPLANLKNAEGIDRFWSIGEGYVFRNFANQYHLFSPEGYESFNIQRYSELVFSSHTKGIFPQNVQRADVELYTAKNIKELEDNYYTKRIMTILGIRYILAKHSETNLPDTPSFHRFRSDGIYDMYEYKKAAPRYLLASRYIVRNSPQDILNALYDPQADLSQTLVLETQPDFSPDPSADPKGTVTLLSYETDRVQFAVDSAVSALLFLSDNYYPGWKARIDNAETPIYRTDYAFRSVVVPAGHHLVTFLYQPLSVTMGFVLSVLGVILCFVLVFLSPHFLKKR